eukprot:TRINITY_DN5433_c0_g1_i1.p1 TRINITY_DN5433_c0_g1~~TRINITY_DN5433_c0_g1_i1.p1  ORF type:complete len:121 (-),score=21.05 TRINITY_DN5433_c0_g1_i1:88-450(-)
MKFIVYCGVVSLSFLISLAVSEDRHQPKWNIKEVLRSRFGPSTPSTTTTTEPWVYTTLRNLGPPINIGGTGSGYAVPLGGKRTSNQGTPDSSVPSSVKRSSFSSSLRLMLPLLVLPAFVL